MNRHYKKTLENTARQRGLVLLRNIKARWGLYREDTFSPIASRKTLKEIEDVLAEYPRIPQRNYENIAIKAGFHQDIDGTVIPNNPDQEGFWEDWEDCCLANGLLRD